MKNNVQFTPPAVAGAARPIAPVRYQEKPVISARRAAELVPDGATLTTGGGAHCGHPDLLTEALAERFQHDRHPRDLRLLFASGQGDGADRGLNRLAHKGLLRSVIGGHWGFTPALANLAERGDIAASTWPQGVISRLFGAIAGGRPGVLSDVGLHTFIDPRQGGGRLGAASSDTPVTVVTLGERETLFYPAMPIDVAFLRGTRADIYGNVSMEDEANVQDSLVQAQATRNAGGIVIVQVQEVVEKYGLPAQKITIPGIYVDYLVEGTGDAHWQTYAGRFNGGYTGAFRARAGQQQAMPFGVDKIIARRAFLEIAKLDFPVLNLGRGIPESIAAILDEEKSLPHVLTTDTGMIGGTLATGLSSGATTNPQAVLDRTAQFDFYDGGGLDLAFLAFGAIDSQGNVDVREFGGQLNGAGAIANVAQGTRRIVFCGPFTDDGLDIDVVDGKLAIRTEGKRPKFVEAVAQISFNARYAALKGHRILVVTERAVFRVEAGRLVLAEIAPGIDIEKDIRQQCQADIVIPDHVPLMAAGIFHVAAMSSADMFLGYRN